MESSVQLLGAMVSDFLALQEGVTECEVVVDNPNLVILGLRHNNTPISLSVNRTE